MNYTIQGKDLLEKMKTAVESSMDGIALLDANGLYYYLNEVHITMFGYANEEELKGKSWHYIYDQAETNRINHEIFPILKKQKKWRGETTGISKTGKPVYQEITLTILDDGGIICICRDIEQRIRNRQQTRVHEKILEQSNSMLMTTDRNREITWVNEAFCRTSGYSPAEAIGKNPGKLLQGENSNRATILQFREALSNNEPIQCELINYKKDGTPYWVNIRCQPLLNEEGLIEGFFAIEEDITERKKLEEELVQAKNSAEANLKIKRRFLANISHEIRTPMHAIMGIAEQLTHSILNEKQDYYLKIINDSSRALLGIINDVLDISKIEEGKLKINRVEFGLREIFYNVFSLFGDAAEQKNLHYSLQFDEKLNKIFVGDPARIRQILLNILSNAVKFTEKGSITLSCRLHSRSDDQYNVIFDCSDTGIGMNDDMKNRLFQDFSQEDESFERKYGGSGLGLAITHELVQLMNGTIGIKSIKGSGTMVSIVLPFTESKDQFFLQVPEKNRPVAGHERLSRLSVLVAEDNQFNRLLLQIMLGNNEICFDMADNGIQAVELAARKKYDLILMDIQMPEMDGIEATKKIRHLSGNKLPIIAITANAVEEELKAYLKEGLTDYLTKPFDEQKLIRKIREHIH